MDILERMQQENKAEGGFVFVSHSHADIAQVRKLRNALEQAGFEPLCFYLKCMDKCGEDPTLREELRALLRREIEAREWFVYVNSKHSEKSSWVQYERDCVKSCGSKKIFEMDLDAPNSPEQMTRKILKSLRIFISSHNQDQHLVRRIKQKLLEKDYQVFCGDDITLGSNWTETIANAILEASKSGCVLALLSKDAMGSPYVLDEIYFALENNGNVIPVLLGDFPLSAEMRMLLAKTQTYRLSSAPSEKELDRMVHWLGRRIEENAKDLSL